MNEYLEYYQKKAEKHGPPDNPQLVAAVTLLISYDGTEPDKASALNYFNLILQSTAPLDYLNALIKASSILANWAESEMMKNREIVFQERQLNY